MVTAHGPESEVIERHLAKPVMRKGRATCPRCGTTLQPSYDELACIACGYEFTLEVEDGESR